MAHPGRFVAARRASWPSTWPIRLKSLTRQWKRSLAICREIRLNQGAAIPWSDLAGHRLGNGRASLDGCGANRLARPSRISLKIKAFGQLLEQRKQQSGGITTAAITPEEMSHAIAQATGCLSIEGRSHDEAFDLLFRDCATQARNMDLSKPIGYGGNGDDLALKVRCRLVDQMPDKAVMTRIRKETLSAVQAMRKKAGTVSADPPKRAELRKALDQAIDKIVQPTARENSLRVKRSLDVFW